MRTRPKERRPLRGSSARAQRRVQRRPPVIVRATDVGGGRAITERGGGTQLCGHRRRTQDRATDKRCSYQRRIKKVPNLGKDQAIFAQATEIPTPPPHVANPSPSRCQQRSENEAGTQSRSRVLRLALRLTRWATKPLTGETTGMII